MNDQENYKELPVTEEYRDQLINFCDSLLGAHQEYAAYRDHQYNVGPIDIFSIFKKNKAPKQTLHEQEWILRFQPPEGFESLTLQKQVHPDANPTVLRYALLLNDTDYTHFIWIWIQKPNEVDPDVPLYVYLITGELGNISSTTIAQPYVDKLLGLFHTSSPQK